MTCKQRCFRGLRPRRPTIRTPSVAREIALKIVAAVNVDKFYWEEEELPERRADVADEIMRGGRPAAVFARLRKKRAAISDHYHWKGIDQYCRAIAGKIAKKVLAKAIAAWERDYA